MALGMFATSTTTTEPQTTREQVTPPVSANKPQKPYAEFLLTARANWQWCKKIRGKVHFFGVWADPRAALQKYLDYRDDLQAGRIPRRLSGLPTIPGNAKS